MERRSSGWSKAFWLALALSTIAPAARALDDPAQRVLVVCNDKEPESRKLAEYYMERRNIPRDRLCVLSIRDSETITRQEFNRFIRAPILKFMTDHGLIFQLEQPGAATTRIETFDIKINCLVLMYGVPLRIDEDSRLVETPPKGLAAVACRNQASVDSDLTLLPSPSAPLIAWVPNPFYNKPVTTLPAAMNNLMVLVARLDGPDAATVRRMIDDAIATERYGLLGRCYFDSRDTQEAGYVDGDRWIKNAYKAFLAAGYECDHEDTPALYPDDYPMTDAAVYAGWYTTTVTGPFQREDFHFRPGAVAYHLHSGSASRIRTRTTHWVGPLLARGAAVSFGNVYEPYLFMTPHLDIFFERLLGGANYVNAGWASQPGLSWQTTFLGDPLYRPFAVQVDEQITRLELDKRPELEWAYVRQVNLLTAADKAGEAEKLCEQKATALKSAVLAEKLGDIRHKDKREGAAATAYQQALTGTGDRYGRYRIGAKLAAAYDADHQPALALGIYESLVTNSPAASKIMILQKAQEAARQTGDTARAEAFGKEREELIASRAEKKK